MLNIRKVKKIDNIVDCEYRYDGYGEWGHLTYDLNNGEYIRDVYCERDYPEMKEYLRYLYYLLNENTDWSKTEFCSAWY